MSKIKNFVEGDLYTDLGVYAIWHKYRTDRGGHVPELMIISDKSAHTDQPTIRTERRIDGEPGNDLLDRYLQTAHAHDNSLKLILVNNGNSHWSMMAMIGKKFWHIDSFQEGGKDTIPSWLKLDGFEQQAVAHSKQQTSGLGCGIHAVINACAAFEAYAELTQRGAIPDAATFSAKFAEKLRYAEPIHAEAVREGGLRAAHAQRGGCFDVYARHLADQGLSQAGLDKDRNIRRIEDAHREQIHMAYAVYVGNMPNSTEADRMLRQKLNDYYDQNRAHIPSSTSKKDFTENFISSLTENGDIFRHIGFDHRDGFESMILSFFTHPIISSSRSAGNNRNIVNSASSIRASSSHHLQTTAPVKAVPFDAFEKKLIEDLKNVTNYNVAMNVFMAQEHISDAFVQSGSTLDADGKNGTITWDHPDHLGKKEHQMIYEMKDGKIVSIKAGQECSAIVPPEATKTNGKENGGFNIVTYQNGQASYLLEPKSGHSEIKYKESIDDSRERTLSHTTLETRRQAREVTTIIAGMRMNNIDSRNAAETHRERFNRQLQANAITVGH